MAAAKTRSWVHMLGFAFVMAAAVYIILDLEHPRMGLINIHCRRPGAGGSAAQHEVTSSPCDFETATFRLMTNPAVIGLDLGGTKLAGAHLHPQGQDSPQERRSSGGPPGAARWAN